jgi:hypothetical protein
LDSGASILGTASGDATPAASLGAAVSVFVCDCALVSVGRFGSDGADRERTGLAESVAALSVVCCAGFPSERKYQHLR